MEKKEKLKKKSIFMKLKEKVDAIFENSKLTFLGKIFMITIYTIISTIACMIPIEIVEQVFKLANLKVGFGFIKGMLLTLFIISFLATLILIGAEILNQADNDCSILEVNDE